MAGPRRERKTRRLIAALVAAGALLGCAAFTGCAPDRDGSGKEGAALGGAQGSAPGQRNTKGAPRIGMAFDVGGHADGSFNASAMAGLTQVASQYSGRLNGNPSGPSFGDKVEIDWLESRVGPEDHAQVLESLVEDGAGLVFAMGILYSDAVSRIARENPGVHFVLVDGYLPDLSESSNLTCVSFAEEQGSFLAGVLAGAMVKANPKAKLGFIGGMDSAVTRRFESGFVAGASWANPNLRKPGMIARQFIGRDGSAFANPKAAHDLGAAMYRDGVEIVYHAAGASGAGLFSAALEAGKLAIGVDSDQAALLMAEGRDPQAREKAKLIVSSMLKRVDGVVLSLCGEYIQRGKVKGGYLAYGLSMNGVGLATNEWNKQRLAPFNAVVDEARMQILAGNLKVPADAQGLADFLKALK